MRERIVDLHYGEDVLLLARFGALAHLPAAIRDGERAAALTRRALTNAANLRKVRLYLAQNLPTSPMPRSTDMQVAGIVEAALRDRRLQVAVLRRNWHQQPAPPPPELSRQQAPALPPAAARPLPQAAVASSSAPHMLAKASTPSPPPFAAPQDDRKRNAVADWSMEERVAEVIRLAADRVPGEAKEMLLGLITPESIALMVGIAGLAAAAHLTPFGWAADAFILALAFAAGGMVAIHAAGNLNEFLNAIVDAQVPADLDRAADHLAEAVVEIGAVALIAILRRFARGSEGDAGATRAVRKPTRRSVEEKAARRPSKSGSAAKAKAPEKTAKTEKAAKAAEAGTGKYGYKLDKAPDDLVADPKGVYGYKPKEGSQFDTAKGWPDWSDPEAVAKARATRLEYHRGLAEEKAWVESMRAKGAGDEKIARELVDMRNKSRLSHYAEAELPKVYERNAAKYGNPYGPSYDSQLAKYGTPQGVIDAATRSNPTMDVLTGIASVK